MRLNKKAKRIIQKQNIEMFKCFCGSVKPVVYRTRDNEIYFYCDQHKKLA